MQGLNLGLSLASNCSPGTVTFTLTVSNKGTEAAAADIVLTNDLPTGLSLVSTVAPNWDCSASTTTTLSCTYDGANMPFFPGDPPLVISVTVAIGPNASPIFSNKAKLEILGDLLTADDNGSVVCNNVPPAPAPALSPFGLFFAGLVLIGIASLALRRRSGQF